LNVSAIREDFPILHQMVSGKPLIYLDNAATSQKPEAVIQVMDEYYRKYNANVHRGIHYLAEEATARYEDGRRKIAKFINAKSHRQIVFVRNTTEAINLVAYSWGRKSITEGDEIILTVMEHHSNIVPWQLLAQATGAKLRFVDVDERGLLRLDQYFDLLGPRTRLVGVTHMSNVLGTINPVPEIAAAAHQVGAMVLVDGAQSVPHMPVNVQTLGCDFLAFSGHKMCGPTGIGVLWARRELLDAMDPFLGGGDMIREVHLYESTWNELPYKFEAGTPAIVEGIGLGAAVDYLNGLSMSAVREHEKEMVAYALQRIQSVKGIEVYGPPDPEQRGGVVAFTLPGIHPHDVAAILDREGIAVRAGHHCAMPLHQRLNLVATTRASLYLYNMPEEVERLAEGLEKVKKVFGG